MFGKYLHLGGNVGSRNPRIEKANLAKRIREEGAQSVIDGWFVGRKSGEILDLSKATLHNADFRDAELARVDFTEADLRHANFEKVRFMSRSLKRAKLMYANLKGANLCGADLSCADLSYACLESASLNAAILHGARLIGADLRNTLLADVQGLGSIEGLPWLVDEENLKFIMAHMRYNMMRLGPRASGK